jgi:hypothetical protein
MIFCAAYTLLVAGSLAMEGSYRSPIPLYPDQLPLFPVLVSYFVFGLLFSVSIVRFGGLVERAQRAVCIVCASYLISFIISSLLLTFFDIFDRLDGDRFTEVGRLLRLGSGDLNAIGFQFAGWLWLPMMFAVFWAQRKKETKPLLLYCNKSLLLFAWIGMIVSVPAGWVSMVHSNGGFLEGLGPALEKCLPYSIMVFLLAIGPAVQVAENTQLPIMRSLSIRNRTSGSGQYIASARKVATTSLLVTIFGLGSAWSHGQNLEQLLKIRAGFAHDVVVTALSDVGDFSNWLFERKLTGKKYDDLNSDFAWLGAHTPPKLNLEIPWAEEVKIRPVSVQVHDALDNFQDGIVFAVDVAESGSSQSWRAYAVIDFTDRVAKPTATATAAVRGGFDAKDNFAATYFAAKNAVLAKNVEIPVSGLSFPVEHIGVIVFIGVLACLVVLSDRLSKILSDVHSGGDEPWMLLDADTLAGRAISGLWVFSLFCAPWLLSSAYIWHTALRLRAAGSVASLRHDFFTAGLLIVIIVSTAWFSVEALVNLAAAYQLRRNPGREEQATGVSSGSAVSALSAGAP